MPELPDLSVYLECIEARALGQRLTGLRIGHPFLLRSVTPPPAAFLGRKLQSTGRIGKRLVLEFDGGMRAVIHLMILGRLHWKKPKAALPKGSGLAAFDFDKGTLLLTESGKKRRAALHLLDASASSAELDRGGAEVFELEPAAFGERLQRENHTLKRALTDPRIFAGIGNAYSDEILHRARLSPFKQTRGLSSDEQARLYAASRAVLSEWTQQLRIEAAHNGGWPPRVTAFHPQMAVHGRYLKPCPDCGSPVQRIVYSSNEANYCARCQTEGRLLADRALSRLLHDSWPKTLDDA
ncbi:MAG: formamidopyrimidine-DNA glycosylase [Hydrocarboniphaga sp.]|uniref:Fpg/Nei family DNA glycosylase n=1 Tax=Hydrocarboniphaga sp. TaxID=2033016 RepID=UPI0026091D5F|nr:DNA-formamidopyrimidine glycosylase family protein [Hydrocarboniphaga sp.]MDB5968305.1 formamidopyrimidine-DNA glycosylase [Hydrocarboniphaga sp.]